MIDHEVFTVNNCSRKKKKNYAKVINNHSML